MLCSIPYKDQDAAVSVKRQLRDLSSKVRKTIQPVFTSRKLNQDLSLREPKPNIVTQQCVVYLFKCDLCDSGYVGYTKGHLHVRVEGHRQKASSICKHYYKEHFWGFGKYPSGGPLTMSSSHHVFTSLREPHPVASCAYHHWLAALLTCSRVMSG